MKKLIINADDFGYSYSINKGILEAFNNGVITSTTVLVDSLAAHEANQLSDLTGLSVGLHFYPVGDQYASELRRQVELFKKLVGRMPDSVDTHKTNTIDVAGIKVELEKYSSEHNTPIRKFGYVKFIDSFFDDRTDGVSINSLRNAIEQMDEGYNELMCHVGYSDEYLREKSSYSDSREKELETLLSAEAKELLASIELCNWNDVIPIDLHRAAS